MTRERFELENKGECWVIIDNYKKRMVSSASDIVDLLNKQEQQIDYLKLIVRCNCPSVFAKKVMQNLEEMMCDD